MFYLTIFHEGFFIHSLLTKINTTFTTVKVEQSCSVPWTFQKLFIFFCLSSLLVIGVSDTVSDNGYWLVKAASCRKPCSNAWFCSQLIQASPIFVQWKFRHVILTGGDWEPWNLVSISICEKVYVKKYMWKSKWKIICID